MALQDHLRPVSSSQGFYVFVSVVSWPDSEGVWSSLCSMTVLRSSLTFLRPAMAIRVRPLTLLFRSMAFKAFLVTWGSFETLISKVLSISFRSASDLCLLWTSKHFLEVSFKTLLLKLLIFFRLGFLLSYFKTFLWFLTCFAMFAHIVLLPEFAC